MSQTEQYIDEYWNIHNTDEILGKGGQGVVFRTKDPDLAIKLVTDESGIPITDSINLKKYSQRLRRIRLLPIPEGLNISLPSALLKDHAGYVMQLLSDMVPFSNFFLDTNSAEKITEFDIPDWLKGIPGYEAKKIIHYCKTGGLRRRLSALSTCSSLLARLHGYGLVYGDISPNNIFISKDLKHSSVWLIDADNIRFEIILGGNTVYTPKYGAPELVQGLDSGRPVSDCHAFAVVAFNLLTLIHPFIGNKVEGTDDSDWADEENDEQDIDEKAYAGFIPWIDDHVDNSNHTEKGLPRQLILNEKLATLFQRTFSEGRIDSWKRPAIFHWPEAFAQASDTTIKCSSCEMTYYYDFEESGSSEKKCPYCETLQAELITFDSYNWYGSEAQLETPCWRFIREIKNETPILIPQRLFSGYTLTESDSSELEISITDDSILIKKSEQGTFELSIAAENFQCGKFQRIISQTKLKREHKDVRFWIYVNSVEPRLIIVSISGGHR